MQDTEYNEIRKKLYNAHYKLELLDSNDPDYEEKYEEAKKELEKIRQELEKYAWENRKEGKSR